MVLNRRVWRNLKRDFFRNTALFLLIALGMYFVVSFVGSAETIMSGIDHFQEKNNMEDGEFSMFLPLTDEQKDKLGEKGADIQEQFYLNFEYENESTVRVFEMRDRINRVQLDDGKEPAADNEAVLEQHFAEAHGIKAGDTISLAGRQILVVGTGSCADYEKVLENMSDVNVDSNDFGVAFFTKDGYRILKDSEAAIEAETISYAYSLGKGLDETELKDQLKDTEQNKLLSFVPADSNSRIGNAAKDVSMNKEGGILGGILLFLIFVYVISVFTVHRIEEENVMIGTLYSLGISKSEVIRSYTLLPLLLTFLGGIFGTILGFSPIGINVQTASTYKSYSLPAMETKYPIFLIAYGLVVPSLIFLIVNYLCLERKLSKEPLVLLRNQKNRKALKLHLPHLSFTGKFRIRQMIREKRSILAMGGGLFLTVLLLMMALDIQAGLSYMKNGIDSDMKYEKMYMLTSMLDEVPEGAEKVCVKTFSAVTPEDEKLNVSVMGISDDSAYFSFEASNDEEKITVSNSVQLKYHLNVGDKLTLRDETNDKDHVFEVERIEEYAPGLCVFMNIDTMCELLEQEEGYYNALLSDKELDIEKSLIYGKTTRSDMIKFSDVFLESMTPMIGSLYFVSVIIFLIVMYLMMKVIVDRADFPIALFRTFGYQNNEIRRLFLDGNFIAIAVMSVVIVPLCKYLMDKMWPSLVSYVPMGLDVKFRPYYYFIIVGLILASYLLINFILMQKLKKNEEDIVSILKERE